MFMENWGIFKGIKFGRPEVRSLGLPEDIPIVNMIVFSPAVTLQWNAGTSGPILTSLVIGPGEA